MERSPPVRSSWFNAVSGLVGLGAALWLGYLALSQGLPPPAAQERETSSPPPAFAACVMDRDGYWTGRVFGSRELAIDWRGEALSCAGNARPHGRGLRLFFAGHPTTGADRLVLVIGVAADIAGLAGREHPVSLTLIDEASSQFFHTPADRCFIRVREVAALGGGGSYRVEGDLYCVGAIPAVSGAGSVTLGDMKFAGRLTLDAN
jgi:hypothetical protein